MHPEENDKHNQPCADKDLLTGREKEIAILICKEYSNKQIAGDLDISPNTVLAHKKSIRVKTKSYTLVGIVVFAIRHGIYIPTIACIASSLLGIGGDFYEIAAMDIAA